MPATDSVAFNRQLLPINNDQIADFLACQKCSGCGELVEKELSVRMHNCRSCGLVLDRGHKTAINILALGLQSIGRQTIKAALS
jgi:ribosomal protein L37AE/L43A